ncbi:hypothetical protein JTL67_34350, partial [Pseudomonas aeruginosa]|nr:hypothetical protein [Pseudomonas aeruginosa]
VWSSGASDTHIILCALKACAAHADRAVFAQDEITASDATLPSRTGCIGSNSLQSRDTERCSDHEAQDEGYFAQQFGRAIHFGL